MSTPGASHGNGRPRDPNSIVSRLERIYLDNPHEWYTLNDLMLKLGCSENEVRNAIRGLDVNNRMTIRPVMVYARVADE